MKKVVLTSILFTGALFSCTKPVPNHPVDPAVKAAFAYQPGTYWIFQDSISNEIDSFFVTSMTTNKLPYPDVGTTQYTTDQIQVVITDENTTNGQATATYTVFLILNSLLLKFEENRDDAETQGITYPFVLGTQLISSHNGHPDTLTVLPSISINNNLFDTVAIYHTQFNDITIANRNIDDYFFINANVGLIKIVLNHTLNSTYNNWKLLRWHLVK